ncbi:MAG: ribonuclease R [Ginsengibacter sp.]
MNKKEPGKTTKPAKKLLTGKIDVTRSGIGYVIIEGFDKDIFIRPHDFNRALHGDTVRVKISENRGKRTEGRIEEILERKQTEFIGDIEVSENFAFFKPDSQKPMPDFYISLKNLNGAKNNDRVVVRLLKWDKDAKNPEGEVISVIQAKDVNDMAMKEILAESGFPLVFSKGVLDEASQLSDVLNEEEIGKRKDCRNILTFTIDPVDAKDFDDALSIKKISGSEYEIGVHIADVSHFVKPETELDKSGYERATSVYLPDRVNPMLPEKISNELCSLRPHENKCTFSVIFRINSNAEVKEYWLGKTIIYSDHRFTYEEVQQIIDDREGLYSEEILLLNTLAQKFRSERFINGAINFSSTEVKFILDENAKPTGVVVKESSESHQLIEEFMLLANRTIAEHVSKIHINKKPVPFPYRIHDTPDDEKLKPFAAFAKKFGYHFDMNNEAAVAASFNKLLMDVKGKPEQHVLEQLGIRTMAKAIYTSENVGHYGLGFEHYCHFTSPIRRYPDIMVHRVLQEILDKNIIPDKKMEEKCKHCSEKERAAMDAERAGNKYKQVEFMQDFIGDEFEGVISGVSSFGFWVETVKHKCEGLVSVRDLSEYDDFRLDETDYALAGLRSGRKFRMGDLITIKLISANLGKRQLDFEWVQKKDNRQPANNSLKGKKQKPKKETSKNRKKK